MDSCQSKLVFDWAEKLAELYNLELPLISALVRSSSRENDTIGDDEREALISEARERVFSAMDEVKRISDELYGFHRQARAETENAGRKGACDGKSS